MLNIPSPIDNREQKESPSLRMPNHPRLSHDHGVPQGAARSHSRGRGGSGAVRGPLRLPWGGVGPLARLLQQVSGPIIHCLRISGERATQ
jgi:hypothetical protein